MIKKFRFTVEIKAQIHDSPKGVGQGETYEKVRRLVKCIADDEKALVEMYKVIFFDLLFGDYYSDEIRLMAKPRTEKELILPVVNNLDAQDSAFFQELFIESQQKDFKVDKDNVWNLFDSQFGNPEIVRVRFECIKKECDEE